MGLIARGQTSSVQRQGLAGSVSPSMKTWSRSTAAIAGNVVYFGRWVPDESGLITGHGFHVLTAATGADASKVGLYDSLGNRLATSASATNKLNALGRQTQLFTTPYSVTAGTAYYPAIYLGTVITVAPQLLLAVVGTFQENQLFGTGFPTELMGRDNAAGDITATVTFGAIAQSPILTPLVG